MYGIEKIIKSVSEYIVYKNYIGYKDTASLKEKTLYLNGKPISDAITGFSFFNKKLFFSNWNNEVFKYDLVTENIIKTEYKQVSVLSDSNKLILKKDDLFSDILLRNNKTHTIKNELIVMKSYIHNELIFNANGYISSYHIPTAQPLWQFDLSQLGTFQDYNNEKQAYKVEKFIGIHNNELLVACSGGKILSIDVQTGKLLQTWDNIPAGYMQLDKQSGKLIGLSDYLYAEVDLNTKKTLIKNIKNNIEEAGLRAFKGGRDMPFTGTHIFYTAYGHDTKTDYLFDAVIALNRNTHKIDWLYIVDASVGTNAPKLAGNKLYQLDLDGNLYIFEKEENETI